LTIVFASRARGCRVAAAAVLSLAVWLAPAGDAGARGVKVGRPARVFDWSRDACNSLHYPDLPVRAFRDARGRVHLVLAHYVNRAMVGRDLAHLRPRCRVILRSRFDPDPSRFQDRQWIAATYTRDGRTVVALLHDEYQGNTHPGRCATGLYMRCWYNAVTLAESVDGGRSFDAAPPPLNFAAGLPSPYKPDRGVQGLFAPSSIVFNRRDRHYYAFAHILRRRLHGACLLRMADLGDPATWLGWGGRGFSVRFANPYAQPIASPREHVCLPLARRQIGDMSNSLTWNTYFKRFLLVGLAARRPAPGRGPVWGVYYSLSRDLLHWTRRRLLMRAELPWTHRCGDRRPIAYPSVLDPRSRSRSFETTGRRPYLFYTRFNYRRCRMSPDRDLLRARLRFSR
jgi:hypothetical protein